MDKSKVIEKLQEMAAANTSETVRITEERKEALNLALFMLDEYDKRQAGREDAVAILEEAEKTRERSARNVQTAYKLLEDVEAQTKVCEGILDDARITSEETAEYLKKAGQRLAIQLVLLAIQVGTFIAMLKIF
ncbi:MAG: hypothetical protein IJ410_03380 [Oscillospiraceae bacterium]|nr:hypothetical protein [Oscillospiraceae bacterium]